MKQQVLKALANPARIFYVPYNIAILNFAVQFFIYVIVFVIILTVSGGERSLNPLYFLISLIAVHVFLMGYSKKEPQLANIISAKIQLLKIRAPKFLRG